MSVNNFLVPIQVRLSPNLVSHTPGHRGRGDSISEGHGHWGGMRSTTLLVFVGFNLFFVIVCFCSRTLHCQVIRN